MQFQRKRMNQTWENGKKTSFSSLFDPNAGPKIFFHGFYLNWVLDIAQAIILYNFKENLLNKLEKMAKKNSFGTDFCPLGPKNFLHGFYLFYMLDIFASYHCMQLQGKLMNQTWENGKKPLVLEPISAHLAQIWPANFFFFFFKNLASSVTRYHGKLSSCTITEKNNDPILRKLSDGEWFHRTLSD